MTLPRPAVGIEPPTPETIERLRTARGGWTRAQLAEWGMPWPPPKGWKKALEAKSADPCRLKNISREELEQGDCDACIHYGNDVNNPVKHDPEDCPHLPLLVHFDGACWPNPGGVLGWGVTIERGRVVLLELAAGLPASASNTNNVAEYLALTAALEWLLEQGHGTARIHIRGDSRLVLRQCFPNGRGRTWRLKEGSYVEHARHARELLARFSFVTGEWIAREGNRRADALSQKGVREVGHG